jgi:hypothetical protein
VKQSGGRPGLKPALICRRYAGVETPASLRIKFFAACLER